jgi:BirA family transcriptional regulator, biotin operon repressor / biotin---[acetyl-CoA-carboxylase] ligase
MSESCFDRAEFERLCRQRGLGLGTPLVTSVLTGSTNDDALSAARAGAPHGATFVADQQTHGRGRRGRRWLARPEEALLTSIVLRLELEPVRFGLLPLATGLAVRAALSELLPSELDPLIRVKWPNDVWVSQKKIAGVLAESRLGGSMPTVVVGIGVNVASRELPEELRNTATSLALLGVPCKRERLLAGVLACLELRLGLLSHDSGAIVSEFRQHDGLLGRRVLVDGTGGIADGIDHEGRLCLRLDSGERSDIRTGSVELLD